MNRALGHIETLQGSPLVNKLRQDGFWKTIRSWFWQLRSVRTVRNRLPPLLTSFLL